MAIEDLMNFEITKPPIGKPDANTPADQTGKTYKGFTISQASKAIGGNSLSQFLERIWLFFTVGNFAEWYNIETVKKKFKEMSSDDITTLNKRLMEVFPDKITDQKIQALKDKCLIPARRERAIDVWIKNTPENNRAEATKFFKNLTIEQQNNVALLCDSGFLSSTDVASSYEGLSYILNSSSSVYGLIKIKNVASACSNAFTFMGKLFDDGKK